MGIAAMGWPDRLPSDALIGIHVLVVDDDSDARSVPDRPSVLRCPRHGRDHGRGGARNHGRRAGDRQTSPRSPSRLTVAPTVPSGPGEPGSRSSLAKPLDQWDLCRHVAALAGRGDPESL